MELLEVLEKWNHREEVAPLSEEELTEASGTLKVHIVMNKKGKPVKAFLDGAQAREYAKNNDLGAPKSLTVAKPDDFDERKNKLKTKGANPWLFSRAMPWWYYMPYLGSFGGGGHHHHGGHGPGPGNPPPPPPANGNSGGDSGGGDAGGGDAGGGGGE